jgi:energy-coupling factor transporter ATP-binding protein EcfA2
MEVKLNNISFSYDSCKVIDNVSCLIKDNMISAIVGINGSGKSTLLRLIDGLLKPSNGYIKVGTIVCNNNMSYKKKIGYLFQSSLSQVFYSSVYIELQKVLECYGLNDIDKRIRDSIKLVGLDDSILYRSFEKISSSELKKVCLAGILACDCEVLFLDDPFSCLDFSAKNDLLRLIKDLKKKYGKTIIIVSSDVDFIHRFVDYVYLIKDGSIYLEGNKYDVLSNEVAMNYCGLKVPDILHFSNLVLQKKSIKIGYRDEINDLIKDVYRYVK